MSLPWLPWYHRDFLAATQGWTLLERGAYFMLLNAQWEMGPLPTDTRRLAGIIGAHLDELEKVWPVVGPKFQTTPAGLVNARLEQHRDRQVERSEKARESARKRWATNANAHATGSANAHATAYADGDARGHAKSMLPDPDPDPDPKSEPEPPSLRAQKRPGAAARAKLHKEIIALYRELLPQLTNVRSWSKQRASALDRCIDERLAEGKNADQLEYWRKVFNVVASNPWLSGRNGKKRNPGVGGLVWLISLNRNRTNTNLVDVIEGVYDRVDASERRFVAPPDDPLEHRQ